MRGAYRYRYGLLILFLLLFLTSCQPLRQVKTILAGPEKETTAASAIFVSQAETSVLPVMSTLQQTVGSQQPGSMPSASEQKRQLPLDPEFKLEAQDPAWEDQAAGLSGHLTAGFFSMLASDPLNFAYTQYAREQNFAEQKIHLLLSGEKIYLKLTDVEWNWEWVSFDGAHYFRVDRELGGLQAEGELDFLREVQAESLADLQKQAESLVFLREGTTDFAGIPAFFEEYALDGENRVRYFFYEQNPESFAGQNCLGHAHYYLGELEDLVLIHTLANTDEETLFDELQQLEGGES